MDLPTGRGPGIPYLRLFRAQKDVKLRLALLSGELYAFATHWANNREQVCGGEFGWPCVWCGKGIDRQDSLYALALNLGRNQLGVAHVTIGAFNHCDALQAAAKNCRGLQLTVERNGGRTGAVYITVEAQRFPAERLPKVGDWLRPFLLRIWRVNPNACSHADALMPSTVNASAGSTRPAQTPATPIIKLALARPINGSMHDACSMNASVNTAGLAEGLAEGELPAEDQADAAAPRTDKVLSPKNVNDLTRNLFRMGGPYDGCN